MTDTFRAEYRPLTDAEMAKITEIKDVAAHLHDLIGALDPGREAALAKTKLEEAVMWAVKAATV